MTVYFAAPLFTHAEIAYNAACAEKLRAAGHTVILPQETASACNIPEPGWERRVFLANKVSEGTADVVLAVLDGADSDSGTCWEVGYACAKGIPVVGLRTDFRNSGDGRYGVNLMLSESCLWIDTSIDSVIAKLRTKEVR